MIKKMLCVSVMSIMSFWGCAKITIQDLPEFDRVRSINDDDLIAGNAGSRAVIAKADDIPIPVDGGLGISSLTSSINNQGQVAGQYSTPGTGSQHVFAFDPDHGTIDLFVQDTRVSSSINNNLGQVFWTTFNRIKDEQRINVLDEHGSIESIVIPSASIFDANDIGQALSYEFGMTVTAVTTLANTGLTHQRIESPASFTTQMYDINNLGQAVGSVSSQNKAKAVIWDKNGGLRNLLAPGEADGFISSASSINDSSLVALTLVPATGASDREFAFYSPDDGLVRFAPPNIPEPSACVPDSFNVSSSSGATAIPSRDETLNESGLAIVKLRLECRVGRDFPIILIPAVATIEKGIQLLPLPRGLEIEDLFTPVEDNFGNTVNIYNSVDYMDGALNDRGKMILNFRTQLWDGTFTSTAHIYNIGGTD